MVMRLKHPTTKASAAGGATGQNTYLRNTSPHWWVIRQLHYIFDQVPVAGGYLYFVSTLRDGADAKYLLQAAVGSSAFEYGSPITYSSNLTVPWRPLICRPGGTSSGGDDGVAILNWSAHGTNITELKITLFVVECDSEEEAIKAAMG